MVTWLDKLHKGMEARHGSIRDHADRLRVIEMLAARAATTPTHPSGRRWRMWRGYNIMKTQAEELSAEIAGEGVTPAAPPAVLRESLEDVVTPSIRRRLLRR
jgi:hypothetical protein